MKLGDMAVQINLGAVVQDAGKAVEDYRSPRRSAFEGGFRTARSVLECSSPLELIPRPTLQVNRWVPMSN
jgi:hypothetical protein